MTPVATCGWCGGTHSPDTPKGRGDLGPPPGVVAYAPATQASKERAGRALAAFTVAESAFKAAWASVLSGLDTVPVDKESERAIVTMFDIERDLHKIGNVLRGKL